MFMRCGTIEICEIHPLVLCIRKKLYQYVFDSNFELNTFI